MLTIRSFTSCPPALRAAAEHALLELPHCVREQARGDHDQRNPPNRRARYQRQRALLIRRRVIRPGTEREREAPDHRYVRARLTKPIRTKPR